MIPPAGNRSARARLTAFLCTVWVRQAPPSDFPYLLAPVPRARWPAQVASHTLIVTPSSVYRRWTPMPTDSLYKIFVALSAQSDRRVNLLDVVYGELNPGANVRSQSEKQRDDRLSKELTDLAYEGEFLATFILYATKKLCEVLLDCIILGKRPHDLLPSDAAFAIDVLFGLPQPIDAETLKDFLLLHQRLLLAAGITFDEGTLQFTDERFAVFTQSLDFLFNPVARHTRVQLIQELSNRLEVESQQ